jgi:hypothetical protein
MCFASSLCRWLPPPLLAVVRPIFIIICCLYGACQSEIFLIVFVAQLLRVTPEVFDLHLQTSKNFPPFGEPQMTSKSMLLSVSLAVAAALASASVSARTEIQNKGSDTLVNVAQSWAEQYGKINPECGCRRFRRRFGDRHCGDDQRHRGHRQLQPQDEGQGDSRGQGQRARSGRARRWLRCPGHLRTQELSRSIR